ncbi:MAG: hypothetical protein PHS14_05060 [Elusimicrobia bacterium]|nr:hypothetical protein [Elusimicrobiota bacterium]
MKRTIYWILITVVLLPVLDIILGVFSGWDTRVVIKNEFAGPITEVSVAEPVQTLDQIAPGQSRTFHLSGGDDVHDSIRFRSPRKRLFVKGGGPYSGGRPWDLITVTVNKKGQISVAEEKWSRSYFLRKPSNYYYQKPHASVEKLIEGLSVADYGKRSGAASALSYYGVKALPAVPALVKAIRSQKDQYVMIFSCALGKIGAAAIPDILPLLQDQNPQNREAGAYALELMGPDAAPAVASLTGCLRDSVPAVRNHCLTALEKIGAEAKSAVPEIISLSQKLSSDERRTAMDVLEAIGTPEADAVVDAYWLDDFNKSQKKNEH